MKSVCFVRQIPVLGTSLRIDHFDADNGWVVEVQGAEVVIHRPAIPMQNVRAIAPFRVIGVGFAMAEPVLALVEPDTKVSASLPAPASGKARRR